LRGDLDLHVLDGMLSEETQIASGHRETRRPKFIETGLGASAGGEAKGCEGERFHAPELPPGREAIPKSASWAVAPSAGMRQTLLTRGGVST
jgi:hypothetical protein